MVRIWAVQTGQEVRRLEGHANAVIRVAFAPDGKTVLSGSSQYQTVDQTIRLWDLATGKQRGGYGGADRNRVSCAAFAPDGKTALTDGPEPVLLRWKLEE
jgi:WD40 repeat protein